MTLSLELQRVYASAPVNHVFYTALLLTHPNWKTYIARVSGTINDMSLKIDGKTYMFEASEFQLVMPKRDELGLVELALQFRNYGREVIDLIDLAEVGDAPINATVAVYTMGSVDPAMTPIELLLSNVNISKELVTGTASRSDLINSVFPLEVVRVSGNYAYPGLQR